MKTAQLHFVADKWKEISKDADFNKDRCQLVFLFGAGEAITLPAVFEHVRLSFPNAHIVSSSTSGEIMDDIVYDNSVAVTAIQFEKATIRCAQLNVKKGTNSYETGKKLMLELASADLDTVFVLAEGSFSNGSELVSGFNSVNRKKMFYMN